jgi:alpha-galactosidase
MHIVSGIEGDSNHVELQVNMPNKGQVYNLMRDAIVETPAIISKKGVKPTRVGDLPDGLAALCNVQVIVQRLAVEAGVHGDVGLARQAMMLDPVVQDELAAEKAFKELFEVHRDLLPQFKETP